LRFKRIGVIGLGYVGLPLAVAFARKGFTVTGIDSDRRRVSKLARGESYVMDVPSGDIRSALRKRLFKPVSDYRAAASQDALIICVPTPLSKTWTGKV